MKTLYNGVQLTYTDQADLEAQILSLRSLNNLSTDAGSGYTSSATLTRPANTTAYDAGDVFGDNASGIIQFANVGVAGGEVELTAAELRLDINAVPAGMGAFTLELYDSAPDAVADNAAWDLSSAGDRAKYLGSIAITTPVDKGSTLFSQVNGLAKRISLVSSSLYGVLRTDGGFTPASAAVSKITIHTQNVN